MTPVWLQAGMIPAAFAEAHDFAGLMTGLGFLTAWMLDTLAEQASIAPFVFDALLLFVVR